jgi:hypothetical protein
MESLRQEGKPLREPPHDCIERLERDVRAVSARMICTNSGGRP